MELKEKNPIKSISFTIPSLKIEKEGDEPFEINETEVCMSVFANAVNVVITQTKKIGCIIEAYSENTEDIENDEKIYEVRTLFGQRDVEIYELFARNRIFAFMEKELQMSRPDPFTFISPFYAKLLILNISLINIKNEKYHQDIYNHIMKNFTFNFMEFMI